MNMKYGAYTGNISFFIYLKTYYKDYFIALAGSMFLAIILLVINMFLPQKDPYDFSGFYIIFAVLLRVDVPSINMTRNYATPVGRIILHVLLTVVISIPLFITYIVLSSSYGIISAIITQIIYLYAVIVTSLYFFLITNRFARVIIVFIPLITISIFMRTDMYRGVGMYYISGLIFVIGLIALCLFFRRYIKMTEEVRTDYWGGW